MNAGIKLKVNKMLDDWRITPSFLTGSNVLWVL